MGVELKICGVVDPAFAAEAARAGADYIGVIFAARSPRRVTPERAREVAAAARPARVVGVFTEHPVEEIARIAAAVPLDVVQLHGPYGDDVVDSLKRSGLEVWRLQPKPEPADGRGLSPGGEDAVLLDGSARGITGGTGTLADWSRVAALKAAGRRVVLAGGISAENIAAAAATGADVLDANSSLEVAPGVKSSALLARLVAALGAVRASGD